MIARRVEIIVETTKNTATFVPDAAQLAMDWFRRANDAGAISLPNRLMAKANAEDWHLPAGLAHKLKANASPVGRAWSWRENDAGRICRQGFRRRDPIVPLDDHLRAQFSQIMDEVEGETVVIVDQEEHSFFQALVSIIRGGRRTTNCGQAAGRLSHIY